DGDDEVSLGVVFAGQLAAHLHAGFVHRAAGDGGVRAGQVDVLKDATGRGGRGEALGADAFFVDGDELAGLDFADQGGTDGVQCGAFGSDNPAAVEAAQHEGANAVGVTGSVKRVLIHEDEAECA